MSRHALAIIKT